MIVMCLTGAIYPAIDMTTGEKERGTLETLLTSPVARTQLVLGKDYRIDQRRWRRPRCRFPPTDCPVFVHFGPIRPNSAGAGSAGAGRRLPWW